MKTMTLTVLVLLLLTGVMTGQTGRSFFRHKEINVDSVFPKIIPPQYPFDFNNSIRKNPGLSDLGKNHWDFGMDKNFFPDGSSITGENHDFVIVEEDPWSSGSFDNMPIIVPGRNGKLRIKSPDTSYKYYLIIKDPIHNTITR
jgi:hypothetical protein